MNPSSGRAEKLEKYSADFFKKGRKELGFLIVKMQENGADSTPTGSANARMVVFQIHIR